MELRIKDIRDIINTPYSDKWYDKVHAYFRKVYPNYDAELKEAREKRRKDNTLIHREENCPYCRTYTYICKTD